MSRISQKFKQLQRRGEKALIAFITAGDPHLRETERLIFTLEKAGADIIELGVPFSDPMADGPIIQASSERALNQGVTLEKILKLITQIRQKTQIPILLMGYYNPILVLGLQRFARLVKKAGVDGVLVVDLPPEEAKDLRSCLRKQSVDCIFLLTPTSNAGRIHKVLRLASGFLYYVSLTGITGAKLGDLAELQQHIHNIREQTKLPVVVGFGITNPQQAKQISQFSHGVVVGSALVRLIEKKSNSSAIHSQVANFTSLLKESLH